MASRGKKEETKIALSRCFSICGGNKASLSLRIILFSNLFCFHLLLCITGQKPNEYAEVHPTARWLSPALLAGYMLFTNVLLLNLLIAIFR